MGVGDALKAVDRFNAAGAGVHADPGSRAIEDGAEIVAAKRFRRSIYDDVLGEAERLVATPSRQGAR